MEQEYNSKLEELRAQYQSEIDRKRELDEQLKQVKQELEQIETDFPKQVKELKDSITSAKKKTTEYEDKTKILSEELRRLKGTKGA